MRALGLAVLLMASAAMSGPAVATSEISAAQAEQASIQFGAQFSSDTPRSKFTAPGARFKVVLQVRQTLPKNANMLDVTYTLGSETSTVPAYFNLSDNAGQPQGFTVSLNDDSSASALNIVFFADDFFTSTGRRKATLLNGRALLRDGYIFSTSIGGTARYPLVNPTILRIRPVPVAPAT